MIFRTLLPFLCGSLLSLCSLSAAAVEAIPESCLQCKGIREDDRFVMCLYECLGSVSLKDLSTSADAPKAAPAPSENRNLTDGPTLGAWQTWEKHLSDRRITRAALTTSPQTFPFFFEPVTPTLLLLKESDKPVELYLDVRPAPATGFADRLLLQIDDSDIRSYPLVTTDSGHAVRLSDPDLIQAMRRGRVLRIRMDIFTAGTQTFEFSLDGVTDALRWLDGADARRS